MKKRIYGLLGIILSLCIVIQVTGIEALAMHFEDLVIYWGNGPSYKIPLTVNDAPEGVVESFSGSGGAFYVTMSAEAQTYMMLDDSAAAQLDYAMGDNAGQPIVEDGKTYRYGEIQLLWTGTELPEGKNAVANIQSGRTQEYYYDPVEKGYFNTKYDISIDIEGIKNTVVFDFNDGVMRTEDSMPSVEIEYGQYLPLTTPTRTGYVFQGYKLEEARLDGEPYGDFNSVTNTLPAGQQFTAPSTTDGLWTRYAAQWTKSTSELYYFVDSNWSLEPLIESGLKPGTVVIGGADSSYDEYGMRSTEYTLVNLSIGGVPVTSFTGGSVWNLAADGGADPSLPSTAYTGACTLPSETGVYMYAFNSCGVNTGNYEVEGFGSYNVRVVSIDLTPAYMSSMFAFDANGGTGNMEAMENKYLEGLVLPANEFVRPGYIFKGWGDAPVNPTNVYEPGFNLKYLPTVNGEIVTLYAIWEQVTSPLQTLGYGTHYLEADKSYTVESNFTVSGDRTAYAGGNVFTVYTSGNYTIGN